MYRARPRFSTQNPVVLFLTTKTTMQGLFLPAKEREVFAKRSKPETTSIAEKKMARKEPVFRGRRSRFCVVRGQFLQLGHRCFPYVLRRLKFWLQPCCAIFLVFSALSRGQTIRAHWRSLAVKYPYPAGKTHIRNSSADRGRIPRSAQYCAESPPVF